MESEVKEIIENKIVDNDLDYQIYRSVLGQCYRAASFSPDRSTQIGSVIIDSKGQVRYGTVAYNGFVTGWNPTEEDYERPRKYQITAHSERRSIYLAAKLGIYTRGATLCSTWAACDACSIAIVESGISKLVRHHPPHDEAVDRWIASVSLGDEILRAGGVEIIDIHGPIPEGFKILRDGEWFDPSKD
jgi:deoxycytidylate deaminase